MFPIVRGVENGLIRDVCDAVSDRSWHQTLNAYNVGLPRHQGKWLLFYTMLQGYFW